MHYLFLHLLHRLVLQTPRVTTRLFTWKRTHRLGAGNVHKGSHTDSNTPSSQSFRMMNLVHILATYVFKTRFNIILPCTSYASQVPNLLSPFRCLGPISKRCVKFRNVLFFMARRNPPRTPNSQAGGPPLVGHPPSNPPRLQPEDAPCRGLLKTLLCTCSQSRTR
jgi:hypothetical protein